MPGLNLPPYPLNALRRVIDKIILPKFPEVVTYVITSNDVDDNLGKNTQYIIHYGIKADISIGRAKKLYEDSYRLFDMLSFDNTQLRVVTKRVIKGMSI